MARRNCRPQFPHSKTTTLPRYVRYDGSILEKWSELVNPEEHASIFAATSPLGSVTACRAIGAFKVLVFCLALLASDGVWAQQASQEDGEPRNEEARWGRWGRFDTRDYNPRNYDRRFEDQDAEAEADLETEPYQDGYVFIDGEYLSPPYVAQSVAGVVSINGRALQCKFPEPERPNGRFMRSRHRETPETPLQQIENTLETGFIVVAMKDQPPVILADPGSRFDLFSRLLKHNRTGLNPVANIQLPHEFDSALWHRWVSEFAPPENFRERAAAVVSEYEESEANARAEVAAARRLDKLSYPLTICGMVLTVLATGHLLSNRPPTSKSLPVDASPETMRVVSWSLGLVLVLSVLDLAWTVLASQAGQMRELNPFGSNFINDPNMLVIFKMGIIALAVGLLFALRQYRHAQVGAWWACLICTLLTARWLTLNSMFVA